MIYRKKNTGKISFNIRGGIFTALLLLITAGRLEAQQQRVVFNDRTVTTEEAFRQIEEQTEFLISFNRNGFNLGRKVRFKHNNLPLDKALDQLLAKTNRTYIIRGNHVLIIPVRQPVEEAISQLPVRETVSAPIVEIPTEQEEPEQIERVFMGALPKPPVDIDSLERALLLRKIEYPAEIPNEPSLNHSLYYRKRDREGFTPGKPSYTKTLPTYALRTNLLYAAAALAPNIGAEFGIGERSTILTAIGVNGWKTDGTESDNDKLCHWIAQAEYRQWLCERFNGHFLGANAYYGYYNIGGKKIPMVLESGSDKYRYKGNVVGAGVSYGYQLMLGRQWNLEFNAGVGFGYMKYDKYECRRCGKPVEEGLTRTFFAPTKLGISLVFIIK